MALCDRLYAKGAKAVVLFNRFYPTDIDVDKIAFTTGNPFTCAADLSLPLRWAGLVSSAVPAVDLAVSGGVDSWKGVVNSILSGASAVEVASPIIRGGASWISEANDGLEKWQQEKEYESVNDYKGKLNAAEPENADKLMRTQFLKYFSEVH